MKTGTNMANSGFLSAEASSHSVFLLGRLRGRLASSSELFFDKSKHAQFVTSNLNEFLVDFFSKTRCTTGLRYLQWFKWFIPWSRVLLKIWKQ